MSELNTYISSVPVEVYCLIFRNLRTREIFNFLFSCKSAYNITEREVFWFSLLKLCYSFLLSKKREGKPEQLSWKEYLKEAKGYCEFAELLIKRGEYPNKDMFKDSWMGEYIHFVDPFGEEPLDVDVHCDRPEDYIVVQAQGLHIGASMENVSYTGTVPLYLYKRRAGESLNNKIKDIERRRNICLLSFPVVKEREQIEKECRNLLSKKVKNLEEYKSIVRGKFLAVKHVLSYPHFSVGCNSNTMRADDFLDKLAHFNKLGFLRVLKSERDVKKTMCKLYEELF
jgi:hypothetical protein